MSLAACCSYQVRSIWSARPSHSASKVSSLRSSPLPAERASSRVAMKLSAAGVTFGIFVGAAGRSTDGSTSETFS